MFHQEKDTLDLLGKYSQKKEPVKTYPKEENVPVKEKIIYRSMGAFTIEPKKSKENREIEENKFENYEYASFIDRSIAAIVDGIILYVPIIMIETSLIFSTKNIFSVTLFFEIILPFIISIIFWTSKGATPGKMIMNMYIVDRKSGEKIETSQAIIRYIGYFPSMLIFGLGLIWVAIDEKNQGWHDKIADTIVIRKKRSKDIEFS